MVADHRSAASGRCSGRERVEFAAPTGTNVCNEKGMIECSGKTPRCLCGRGPRRSSVHRSLDCARDAPVIRGIARLLVMADLA
jgi:hypothetical protein